MNKQFKNTVISGLQTFRALGFSGMPSEDSIVATAEIWLDLLHPLRNWDNPKNIDALVIAFKVTARTAERFPVPKDVIHNLADLPVTYHALPSARLTDSEMQEVDKMINQLFKEMGMPQVDTSEKLSITRTDGTVVNAMISVK